MRSSPQAAPFPLSPAVVATLVHGTLVAVWWVWVFCTARFPTLDSGQEAWRLITSDRYLALSMANALLAVALLVSLARSPSAAPGLQGARRWGALGGLALLVLIQVGGHLAHGPLGPQDIGHGAAPAESDR